MSKTKHKHTDGLLKQHLTNQLLTNGADTDYFWTPSELVPKYSHNYYHHCESCGHHTYDAEEQRVGEIEYQIKFEETAHHPAFTLLLKGFYSLHLVAEYCSCEMGGRYGFLGELWAEVQTNGEGIALELEEIIDSILLEEQPPIRGIRYDDGTIRPSHIVGNAIKADNQTALECFMQHHADQFEKHIFATESKI